MTLPPIVKLSKEESLFIQKTASAMDGEWFIIPGVFQKCGEDLYRWWDYNNLPEGLKKDLNPILPKSKTNQ